MFPASTTWCLSLVGLALFVFAVVAISSAGRIDVIDAQTRYEVARSLVDHGDSIVRNNDTWFAVFTGRNGQRYSNYRFPHSLVAAATILVADGTGPVSEMRRHFFFSLSGAVLCALIAVLYAGWLRRRGHGLLACLAWAAGGIFCTPTWFYGTTSYDDVLGTLVVLAAIFTAWVLRDRRPTAGAVAAGLLLGLAFNCKPPLVLFMPAVVAALWKAERPASERWLQARIVFLGMAAGVIAYSMYDLWKFPPSTWAALSEARGEYVALWPGNPLAGLLSLLVSPGMGALWYWPALVIALCGLTASARWRGQTLLPCQRSIAGWRRGGWGRSWPHSTVPCQRALLASDAPEASTTGASPRQSFTRPDTTFVAALPQPPSNGIPFHQSTAEPQKPSASDAQRFALMVGLSAGAFLAFIATIRFFSGEPAWGPRYLTPVFGVLWIFVPQGAARLRWPKAALLLAASLVIQVAGLAIEPMRFFTGENVVAAEAFLKNPWTYFRFDRSQLLARPRQIWDVLSYDGPPPATFTPAKQPTLPLIIYVKTKKKFEARNYQVLSSLRPWWITYQHLRPGERPVEIGATLRGLVWTAMAGLATIGCCSLYWHFQKRSAQPLLIGPGSASSQLAAIPQS